MTSLNSATTGGGHKSAVVSLSNSNSDRSNNNVDKKPAHNHPATTLGTNNKVSPIISDDSNYNEMLSMDHANNRIVAKNGHILRSASLSEGMDNHNYKLGTLRTGSVLTEINEKCLHESVDSRHKTDLHNFEM